MNENPYSLAIFASKVTMCSKARISLLLKEMSLKRSPFRIKSSRQSLHFVRNTLRAPSFTTKIQKSTGPSITLSRVENNISKNTFKISQEQDLHLLDLRKIFNAGKLRERAVKHLSLNQIIFLRNYLQLCIKLLEKRSSSFYQKTSISLLEAPSKNSQQNDQWNSDELKKFRHFRDVTGSTCSM